MAKYQVTFEGSLYYQDTVVAKNLKEALKEIYDKFGYKLESYPAVEMKITKVAD